MEYVVQWGLEHRDLSNITAIGVDEIAWRKGHKYLTLVYQIDAGKTCLLWIGKDRTVKTFLGFFRFFGEQRSQALKFICSDMWKPYLKVIEKKAGQAIHILDRFHIVAKLNKAIDEVRADEHRQMKKAGHEPVLKNSRWCLFKRKENLTEKQEIKLKEILKYNLRSVRAYLLKRGFQWLLGICLACLGGKIPGPLVYSCDAFADRTHEKSGQNDTSTQAANSELVQGKSHHEKFLRLSHLSGRRNRVISCAWESAYSANDPQILLRRLNFQVRKV